MLSGLRVLITRAEGQNVGLAEAIEARGGLPVLFPTLVIAPVDHEGALALCPPIQVLIFTSANAAMHLKQLPPGGEIAYCVAMGQGTATQLKARGWPVDLVAPKGATSETLLNQLPIERIRGAHLCIIRGLNGRTILSEALGPVAAQLSELIVYRRECPNRWDTPLPELTDVVVLTSLDGFRHWVHLLGPLHLGRWAQVPHLMTSERQLQVAQQMPCFTRLRCAKAPDTPSIVTSLVEWNLL